MFEQSFDKSTPVPSNGLGGSNGFGFFILEETHQMIEQY